MPIATKAPSLASSIANMPTSSTAYNIMAASMPEPASPKSPSGDVDKYPASQPPYRPPISLQAPTTKKSHQSKSTKKIFRRVRAVFRSFPIITPHCKMPVSFRFSDGHMHSGARISGTVFGRRKSRVNLAIQENPKGVPILVLELAIPTGKVLQDIGVGLVRIALECEKNHAEKTKIVDEPIWTLYYNGRKTGYGVKREPTEDDLLVMQMLHAVSMGAGVLPIEPTDQPDNELTYLRAHFDRVVGSRDSETYHMVNPDGNSDTELSIFFVRL